MNPSIFIHFLFLAASSWRITCNRSKDWTNSSPNWNDVRICPNRSAICDGEFFIYFILGKLSKQVFPAMKSTTSVSYDDPGDVDFVSILCFLRLHSFLTSLSSWNCSTSVMHSNFSDQMATCPVCGMETNGRQLPKHVERCFVRSEKQTSFGTATPVCFLSITSFNAILKMMCRRMNSLAFMLWYNS